MITTIITIIVTTIIIGILLLIPSFTVLGWFTFNTTILRNIKNSKIKYNQFDYSIMHLNYNNEYYIITTTFGLPIFSKFYIYPCKNTNHKNKKILRFTKLHKEIIKHYKNRPK